MPVNILMPALSPTMEKGNLAKWLKKEGDKVKPGDVIAEIETDKATMEYESIDEGMLAKIVVPEGTQDVPVNQLIAVLAEEGEDAKAAAAAGGEGRGASKGRGERPHPALAPNGEREHAERAAADATALHSRSNVPRRKHRQHPLPSGARVGVRALGSTDMAPTASSPRRWRGGSPRKPASTSRASRAPARMGA